MMKKLLMGLLCLVALAMQAQKNEPSADFIKNHAFSISHSNEKSAVLEDASQWIPNWTQWTDENIAGMDLSYLYEFIQPTQQFQHFRVGSSNFVVNVQTQSYIQRLYQRSLLKPSKK